MINVWQALVAGAPVFPGFRMPPRHALVVRSPWRGLRLNAPVWTALIPDVPEDAAFGGHAGLAPDNLSGIVVIPRLLLAITTPPVVFGLNALGFLGVAGPCA